MSKIALVDFSTFIHRAYHAAFARYNKEGMHDPMVLEGAALSILGSMLITLRHEYQKGMLCLDAGDNWRRAYQGYKAGRPGEKFTIEYPEEAMKLAEALGFPTVGYDGAEADDVLASVVMQCDLPFDMHASDKDMLPLLATGRVTMIDAIRGWTWTEQKVRERYGVRSDQMRDYLALVGDDLDNIPGVPGIGPKYGAQLLNIAPLDELLCDPALIPSRWRALLLSHLPQLRVNLALTTLVTDLPLPDSSFDLAPVEMSKVAAICEEHKLLGLQHRAEGVASDRRLIFG